MPSTYSPDLRIELIANGEQSGTWGTTTNVNLGTLIEDAIAGLASVSVTSANQALTALNGAADQARCAAVSLTTTTTAAFNIYVPPVPKLYVINNASAYAATVFCSTVLGNTTAAGTGVAVPAGKSVLLRSDGTNIVEQLNHITGSLSVGGALAVTGASTLTGAATFGSTVTLNANPTLNLQAATKQYVDTTVANGVPAGVIAMWSGTIATIPSGWALCNGSGGTPDLRNRFIIGAHSDDAGVAKTTVTGSPTQTGGSKDATLVSHSHTTDTAGSHQHAIRYTQVGAGGGAGVQFYTPFTQIGTANDGVTAAGSHTHTISTEGSSGTNANLVPYYALAYIIKL
jgi:hypothetical protein